MINFNKIKIHNRALTNDYELYELWIDDFIISGVKVFEVLETRFINFGSKEFGLKVEDYESSKKIATLEINEVLKSNISIFRFNNWAETGIYSINVLLDINKVKSKNFLTFELIADLLLWNWQFTFIEYVDKFENLWELSKVGEFIQKGVGNSFSLKIESSLNNETIEAKINPNLEKILDIHYKTLESLNSNIYDNSIFALFQFPVEIKNSCEQYLLYFAKFLQDLGIDVVSNLKEEAGKVLFSVTPTDNIEALDKIREALAVYLDLPNSPITEIEYSENFALMRLQQQVRNLHHSQQMAKTELLSTQYALKLAQQNIDNQDQLLTRQNSTIENQNKIIEKIMSKSVMMDSLENKEELEELCEGLKIGKSKFLKEQFGIDLNLATFLKGIGKKIIGKPENTSIIETDEEN